MIEKSDVGCWIVKGDPSRWDYFTSRENDITPPIRKHLYPGGWTLGKSYRTDLVEKGDLVALWITGPDEPGIYEFGRVTSESPWLSEGWVAEYVVDQRKGRQQHWAFDYEAVRLWQDYVPRATMKADPVLSQAEQFRAPMISNPTYLTPEESKVLARLLANHVSSSAIEAAGWGHRL